MKNNKPTRGNGFLEGFLAKKRAEKANDLIPRALQRNKILDIGCGYFPYFLLNTKFSQKFGIDPFVSLDLVKKEKVILTKMRVDNEKLPYKDNFFDVVTMLAVFEHIDENKLSLVLKEALRVLNKEGILIITTPSPWSDRLLHQMAKVGLISSDEIHDHKNHYNMGEIVKILADVGFNNIKTGYFEIGFNMWFVAKKR